MIDLDATTAGTGFGVQAAIVDQAMTAAFTGSAELQAFEAMKVVVSSLHEQAVAHQITDVIVDFTKLEFMASSCFKCLVTWISDITDLPEEAKYKLRFRSSKEQLWQRRSLHVLRTFATDLVSIES